MVNTNMTYRDGVAIPFPTYRCKARARRPEKTYTHQCRLHVDHDGPHSCICDMKWAKKVDS